MTRHRNWCFTSFKNDIDGDDERIQYICWGRETCPDTGTIHLQGYVELRQGYSLERTKLILRDPALHLEVRRGTQQQAIEYCRKDVGSSPDPSGGDWYESGVRRAQGKRTDLDQVREVLGDGGSFRTVLAEVASFQGARCAERMG